MSTNNEALKNAQEKAKAHMDAAKWLGEMAENAPNGYAREALKKAEALELIEHLEWLEFAHKLIRSI